MTLTSQHYAMLHDASAISHEVIIARGYQSLTYPDELRDLGFSKAQARTAPALAIPLWNVHGEQTGWQIRPDSPRQMKDGKVFKYETPKGGRVSLDVHPSVHPLLGNPSEPLWITEGVKKGDALASRGACTIALMGGVWGFRGTNEHGGKVILPAWQHVALNGRLVYVVFDSDLATKPNVQAALNALYRFLRERQARPGLVSWPEEFHQSKTGVDDFFAQGHTIEDVLAMVPPIGPLPPAPPRPQPTAPQTIPPDDPAADLGTVSPCTHTANARRLVRLYAPTLRYVLGEGWILWTGTFWRPDPTTDSSLATGFVSGLARSIAEEAAALYTAAAHQPTDAERKALYALAEARGQWAAQSENATVIAGGLKLAKHALVVEHSAINQNPWLFNCHNGTLDLQTGTFRAHDPADLITHLAPVTYDPAATCPTWQRFLLEVFAGDTTMVDFIQRALGWSLTGVVQDRALFFLYGAQGHNGKTTMVETMRDMLGIYGEESFGYARKVDVTTFMKSKNHEDNLRKAAQLTGARFVYSSEIDEEHRLNEQLIKDMTGGDTLEARRLYREAFNFKPTFKPWMYGNHKPEIRGTDDALWSRVKLIEFEVCFADRMDHALPDKLRRELSGILNWALAGCLAWQRDGLQTPEKVKTATAAYRNEQDTIGQFIRERCQTGKEYMQCKASRLYAAYRTWAEHNGHEILSHKRFGTYLTAHGYPSDENATGRGISRKKIALIETPDDDDEEDDTDGSANLRYERLAGRSPSNDATKPHSAPTTANLANLSSRKSPIERTHERLSGSKVSKVSNQGVNCPYPAENSELTVANHQDAKVSNADAPPPCFACHGTVYWRNERGMAMCVHCYPAPANT